jgi:hypothetical protein
MHTSFDISLYKRSLPVFFIALICFFFGSFHELHAQNFKNQEMDAKNMVFFGFGPSMFYGDNGGDYPGMNFPVRPNITAGFNKGILPFMSVRMTTGWQRMVNWDGFKDITKVNWANKGQAASFSGSALYLDIMPQFNLFTLENLGNRPKFNMYGGLGLGTLLVSRNQQIFNPEGSDQSSSESTLSIYIPLRAGASYAIGELYNISMESTLLKTFADDLDGNRGYNHRNDHFFQLNVVLQRYF